MSYFDCQGKLKGDIDAKAVLMAVECHSAASW